MSWYELLVRQYEPPELFVALFAELFVSKSCHFARYLLQLFARYLHHLTGQITLKVESPLADF